jgi:hypothetical protein
MRTVLLVSQVGFVCSTSIAWTALGGVAVMTLFEVLLRGGEGTDVLRHVDGFLLVMIAALFIVIASARKTGVPDTLFLKFGQLSGTGDALCSDGEMNCFDLDFDSFPDVFATSVMIVVLSNLCSNVPTVMLLGHSMKALPLSAESVTVGWLVLSWASTVAGNLTLVGSIANLIVSYPLPRSRYAHFSASSSSLWSSLLSLAIGPCAGGGEVSFRGDRAKLLAALSVRELEHVHYCGGHVHVDQYGGTGDGLTNSNIHITFQIT